jgi:hypothetical protein
MPWKKEFKTIDPETGDVTAAKVKVDEDGVVTHFATGYEHDKVGGKHGHTWNLDKESEEIGGRDPVDSSGKSIYGDQENDNDNLIDESENQMAKEKLFDNEDYSDDIEVSIFRGSEEQGQESKFSEKEDYSDEIETFIAPQECEEQTDSDDFDEEDYSNDVEASIAFQDSEGRAESFDESGDSQDCVDGLDDEESQSDSDSV